MPSIDRTRPVKNTRISLIGICVSYNYFDTLQFMLPVNYLHFEKMYILTQEDDTVTINFCKQFENVVVLYHTFTNNEKTFDKFGALNYAQTLVYIQHPDSWYVIIDSDILLPTNMIDIVMNEQLHSQCIYGANRAIALKSSELVDTTKLIEDGKQIGLSHILSNRLYTPPLIIGYFQLYKKKYVYHPTCSTNAGHGDCAFGYENFKLFCNLENMVVIHLGPDRVNWSGKKQGFIDDIRISLDNVYYTCHIPVHNHYFAANYELIQYGTSNIVNNIVNKKYSWEDHSIHFVDNGLMYAFGKGAYTQLDMYTFLAHFGGRKHTIVFNDDHTTFTSTRSDDGERIQGVLLPSH